MDDLQSHLQKTLGDAYALEHELAGGGMARVFVALERTLERRVVIKTLASDLATAISAERFRREIRLAASLQQANIVPVHSTGEVDGVPYFTMPFVEGESLRDRLKRTGAFPVREAVGVLRDVARALAFAHERGVVHRDIKPENILLSGDTAVVTDFGIAKAIEASKSQAGAPTLTQLGTVLGTPAYLSPEQAAGDASIDHRADIYSLGIVAYELLSGAPPFTDRTVQALIAAHISVAPPPLAQSRPDLPVRLASLVMRCLEKDPARRPESAAELLRALDGAAADIHAPSSALTPTKPSIAVLPFANLSPDPSDEFFADGLTDEIITDLAGVRGLHVIARTAMMRYKGMDKGPVEAARELKVRFVLEGSVRRAGQSLRLTIRLIDAQDDTTLWSDKLNGVVEDVFDMQERVSRTIVDALRVRLTAQESQRLALREIDDLKAYEAYLQARQAIWTFSPDALAGALKLVGAARARIGDSPRLLAAEALIHLGFIESGHAEAGPHLDAIARCATRLAAVAPDSFSYHAVVGQLAWRQGRIREALASLSRALELEPGASDVAVYLAYALLQAGQDLRAREVADRLVELDPLTPLFQVMPGYCEVMAGRPDAAVPYYERFVAAEPSSPIAAYFHLVAVAETTDTEGTLAAARSVAERFPESVFGNIAAIYVDVVTGRLSPTNVQLTPEMRAHSARSDAFARPLAVLLARAGASDAAISALEDSVRLGLAHYPYLARNSRAFDGLRAHPRFRALLETVRARWERGGTSAEDLAETRTAVSRNDLPTVAVLPLANLSASVDDEYFADGVTEDIISQLSQIASLRVISRTSVMGFRKTTKKSRDIGGELGASHLIEGSVRRHGTRVRIIATLIDAHAESHLWSETFDRELTDIFAIQNELAVRITTALVARLTPAEAKRVARRPTSDMEAYNLFLLGRQEYNRATPEAFAKATAFYDQAIARDPAFARAYAAKALVDMYHGGGYWGVRPTVAYESAVALARRAIELDPDVGEAHMVLGAHESWITFDWSASERHFSRALALTPSHAFTHIMYGWYLAAVGRLDDAVQAAQVAVDLDPAAFLIRGNALWFLHLARQHDDFDAHLEGMRRLTPLEGNEAIIRAFEYIGRGRADEALPAVRILASGAPNLFLQVLHAWCAAAANAEGEARQRLAELHDLEQSVYVWGTGLALAYAHLGEPERAFEYLERSFQDRAGWLNVVGCSPAFDIFRGDPRFDALVQRIGVVVVPEVQRRRWPPLPVRSVTTLRSPAAGERRSVAVLPFANLSPDPENEYFADGITDDLIAQVAKIGSLRVIARTSVMRYRGNSIPAAAAARELGVRAVVEGTVRRAGKRARIVVQLVDPSFEAPMWSETYDRDLDDIFSVQTEVATRVAQALRANLTPAEERRLARIATRDAEAYDLYVAGRQHYNRRTPASLDAAISCLEQAVARDPQFAAAHAGIADAYVFAGLGYGRMPPLEAFARAKDAAHRALLLDPESPDALCAMGLAIMHGDWRVKASQAYFERAIATNPNHAPAHQFLGWCLFSEGEYAAAVAPQRRALELDPLNVSLITERGWPYGYAGLHDIALAWSQKAVTLDPDFGLGHYNVGIFRQHSGDVQGAIRSFERAVECMGETPWVVASLATALFETGDVAGCEAILSSLRQQAEQGMAVWLSMAMILDSTGRPDQALDALERGFKEHEPFVWALGLEGWFRLPNIRSHPRFRALLDRLGARPHDIARQRSLLLQLEAKD